MEGVSAVPGTISPVRLGSRHGLRRLGLGAACVLAVAVLAVGVPFAQQARWSAACAEQGGRLERSSEDLEPLLVARTVYTCYGPAGQVLDTW